jgi:hypothetical protein
MDHQHGVTECTGIQWDGLFYMQAGYLVAALFGPRQCKGVCIHQIRKPRHDPGVCRGSLFIIVLSEGSQRAPISL